MLGSGRDKVVGQVEMVQGGGNTTWYGGFGGVAGEEGKRGVSGFVGLTGSNKGVDWAYLVMGWENEWAWCLVLGVVLLVRSVWFL